MGIFDKSPKKRASQVPKQDGNLQAMVFNASHICDSFIRNGSNGYELNTEDWKIIWSSFLFSGARFMSSPSAVEFTDKFIRDSKASPRLKIIHHSVSSFPDERYFYQISSEHQKWLDAVNKQIYEIGFEEALKDSTLAQRQTVYTQVSPMVEHYVFQNVSEVRDAHKAFTEIASSSLALAVEEIVLQRPIYGLEMTKSRYGAAQVYFSFAIFLFNQIV